MQMLHVLDHVIREVVQGPMAIVACGHAAGYVLRHFAGQKENVPHMALVAPTWRGPLPTMMNGKRPDWLKSVRAAVGNHTVGQALYNLNMNERVVEMELARHCGGHDDALGKMYSTKIHAQKMLTVTFLPAESFITSYRQGGDKCAQSHKAHRLCRCEAVRPARALSPGRAARPYQPHHAPEGDMAPAPRCPSPALFPALSPALSLSSFRGAPSL
jgi:hypothetical protein